MPRLHAPGFMNLVYDLRIYGASEFDLNIIQHRDRGATLRLDGHISDSILGEHKTLFLTKSFKF